MLQMSSVSYSYPHAADLAVRDITLSLAPGEVMLCTGRSGCGKSTLTRLVNGLAHHYLGGTVQGQVLVDGQDPLHISPAELARHVGTLFQDPERQFFALTVGDELALSLQWRGWSADDIRQSVDESARLLGIEDMLSHTILGLSEGQKQKVALASLLAARPKLLVLDEPTANLDPESTAELTQILAELKKQDIGMFIVDHRLHWLRDLADSVLVLENGRIMARGDFSMLDDAELRVKYGLRAATVDDPRTTLPDMYTKQEAKSPDRETAFFSCHDLVFAYPKGKPVFSGESHSFNPGDIIALIGENGVGKTTLARLLTGLERPQEGSVQIGGNAVKPKRLSRHVQVVLQNAGHQLRMKSVMSELEDAAEGVVPKEKHAATVQSCMETYALDQLAKRHPQSLSGGEKQRLAVACAAIRQPDMLILDEPTSGLDGENMQRMAESMRRVAADGACLLVISHDLELIQHVCTGKIVLQKNTGDIA